MRTQLILLACLGFVFSSAPAQLLDTIFVSSDVPEQIPDGPDGIAQSFLPITMNGIVRDVNVMVTIQHPFDQDLRLYVEAPNDDVVRLAFQCGGSGDNYINTCFDDSAEIEICDGDPPFTGCFIPNQPLSEFNGFDMFGTWIFRVTDNYAHDSGTIMSWQIQFVYEGLSAPEEILPSVPTLLEVEPVYPNPFNATASLPFELARTSPVSILITNQLGQRVFLNEQIRSAGRHVLTIDGSSWSSGSYFATVSANGQRETVRMLLVK
jgi:subtilisin-like proprotein convertase family protein